MFLIEHHLHREDTSFTAHSVWEEKYIKIRVVWMSARIITDRYKIITGEKKIHVYTRES